MPRVDANGLHFEVERHGREGDPAVMLITGLGFQIPNWPLNFIEGLTEAGFEVIVFDNRDAGLSHSFDQYGYVDPLSLYTMSLDDQRNAVPYTLRNMAEDTLGLMAALDLERPHLVGVSMGGMIAQLVAALSPERVNRLALMMTTTGRSDLPAPSQAAMVAMSGVPASSNRGHVVAHGMRVMKAVMSPAYPTPEDEMEALLGRIYDRAYTPLGTIRQASAIIATGNLRSYSEKITAPTLVLHGGADILVHPEAGRDVAAAIPGATLEIIEGWCHDLPQALMPALAEKISDHFRLATAA